MLIGIKKSLNRWWWIHECFIRKIAKSWFNLQSPVSTWHTSLLLLHCYHQFHQSNFPIAIVKFSVWAIGISFLLLIQKSDICFSVLIKFLILKIQLAHKENVINSQTYHCRCNRPLAAYTILRILYFFFDI